MPHSPRRKHVRLRWNDYRFGSYFVTICCQDRVPYFGEIREGRMVLGAVGEIADDYWLRIPEVFPGVDADEFVVMPNHMHGILHLWEQPGRIERRSPMYNAQHQQIARSLSVIIANYKGMVTKWARAEDYAFRWQGRFHEHKIRDERSLGRIREYIVNNPVRWEADRFYR